MRRLVCPNTNCSNKRVMERRFNSTVVYTCKDCNSVLVNAPAGKLVMKQNEIARKELREQLWQTS